MRTMNRVKGVFILLLFLTFSCPENTFAQERRVDYNTFHKALNPYGKWIEYPSVGRVWIPNVSSDFTPYSTNGNWTLTKYGWTWSSDYKWGWAPFHYGRWDYAKRYGWMWIPGYEWGPSWVSWRSANGYYGWSPMGSGLSIKNSFGRAFNHPNDRWIFVRNKDLLKKNLHSYIIIGNDQEKILRNSQPIRRMGVNSKKTRNYVSGPSREEVAKHSGVNIQLVGLSVKNNQKKAEPNHKVVSKTIKSTLSKTSNHSSKQKK